MKPINKPIHTIFSGVKYDSIFEAKVAKTLQPLVYSGYGIHQQFPLQISSGSANYKPRKWRCDFALVKNSKMVSYIEAKGYVSDTFSYQLEMLDNYDPYAYRKLTIVVPNGFKVPKNWGTVEVLELRDLADRVQSLTQFD